MLVPMCGIAGIVGSRADPETLEAMAQAMAHRGPDGQQVWAGGDAGLAFRRLAIIDLDPRSDQPLHLEHLHMVFNGEIYNYLELRDELVREGHRFVTEGDGEVLLHAWLRWGEQALERVNGMFAFAIWDARAKTLTLASDPFGEKPLYWTRRGERLVFASDIRAILRAEPALGAADAHALQPFLALGLLPPTDRSFFQGISRLPGAHLLRWRAGQIETLRYWHPRRLQAPSSYEDAVERLRELLADSIRLRLRSDVPVGTSLSGGVDSAAVVTLAAQIAGTHTRHAFTASFPGFARDEWARASEVARAANVAEHHRVCPEASELLEDLDRLVLDQEEPFMTTSIYAQWRVMAAAREAGVTVLLDGQGADELFGGYDVSGGWALRSAGAAAALRGIAEGPHRLDRAKALGYDTLPGVLARRYRRTNASPYASADAVAEAVRVDPPAIPGSYPPMTRELLRELTYTSLPGLLRFADRDSMAHSREVRLPYLDRRVAEFALSLPPSYLYRGGMTKRVLRDAVSGLVPASVLEDPEKRRYETPEEAWFSTPAFVARARETLLDPGVRASGLYDVAAIERDARAGRWRDVSALWRALNVELWRASLTESHPRARHESMVS
jgi:asparagine synthase (glutamine-hydrolysing)